jgi:hypothetical protein
VNANPSGSRTSPTESRGRAKARKVLAAAKEPSADQLRYVVFVPITLGPNHLARDFIGGVRREALVCRMPLAATCVAQGRVGDSDSPRHIAFHLMPQQLMSANVSRMLDTVRRLLPSSASPCPASMTTPRLFASQVKSRLGNDSSPRLGVHGPKLFQTCSVADAAPACGKSRGKGVRAP